jgi:hypothetical protein
MARPVAEMAGFRRGEGRAWPGKGGGVVLAHLGFNFDGWKGRRRCQRWFLAAPWICNHGCSVSGEVVGSGDCLAAWGGLVEVRGGGRELRRRWKGAGVDFALRAPTATDRSGQGKTGSAYFHLPSRGTDGWGYWRTSTSLSRLAGAARRQTVASRGCAGRARVRRGDAGGDHLGNSEGRGSTWS